MNEFDERIGKAQINLELTLSEMRDLKESFILSATEFLKPFWEEKARTIVKGEPELLKELGNEKVSELRQEVKKLEENNASQAELEKLLGKGRARAGMLEGDLVNGELEAGQIAAMVNDIPTVKELTARLLEEYALAVKSLPLQF